MSQTGNKELEKSYSKREGCNERRERKQVVRGAASAQLFAAGALKEKKNRSNKRVWRGEGDKHLRSESGRERGRKGKI